MRWNSTGGVLAGAAAAVALQPALLVPWFADLLWQIGEGRQILAGRIPDTVPYAISAGRWIDHEWLFEAIAAFAYDVHAYPFLVLACAVCAAAIPLLIFSSTSQPNVPTAGAGMAAMLSALAMFRYDALRPLTLGAFAFTLLLLMLRRGNTSVLGIFFVTLVWSNVHASCILAPILCLLFMIDARFAGRRSDVSKLAAASIACGLATLCTPNGLAIYGYAAGHLASGSAAIREIDEWRPFAVTSPLDWVVFGVAMLAMVAGSADARTPRIEKILGLLFTAALIHQTRQIAFFVPAISGLAACGFNRLRLPELAPKPARLSLFGVGIAGLASLFQPSLAAATPLGTQAAATGLLDDARLVPPGTIAFIDYNAAGYVAFANLPIRVFIDSHGDCYPSSIWEAWGRIRRLEPGWDADLKKFDIDFVLVRKDAAIAQALVLSPRWKQRAERGDYVAFSRKVSKLPSSSSSHLARSPAVSAIAR